jgi:hypothetical protein
MGLGFLCVLQYMHKNKTRRVHRKAPSGSATKSNLGTIELGIDGNRWVVVQTTNGTKRWSPYHSASLFGFVPLTTKILAKHIGNPLTVYERQSDDNWPTKLSDFDLKYTFTASGGVELNGKIVSGFAKPLKRYDMCIIQGTLISNYYFGTIHAAPNGLVSSNLMNVDAFVRV